MQCHCCLCALAYVASQNEHNDWSMDVDELQRSIDKARAGGADVRALCVINPGNPTGQCLTKQTVEEVRAC